MDSDANSSKSFENRYAGKNLSGQSFSKKILIGADFSNSFCAGCDFSGADLSFANFQGANLYRADFLGAVLYVTHFTDCDLTRANFNEAFIYGAKFSGDVNITYCTFSNMRLEDERRVTALSPTDPSVYRKLQSAGSTGVAKGAKVDPQDVTFRELYGARFVCADYYIEFTKYKPYEKQMELSQIYNRLKRIYKENHFAAEAGEFYYWEKYWQTRSWFTEGTKEDFAFGVVLKRILRTVFAALNESVAGYGEKPFRVVNWMIIGVFAFSALFYLGPFVESTTVGVTSVEKFLMALYHTVCSMLTIDSQLSPIGISRVLTVLAALYGLIMITLLTAIIIRKLIRD
jgi:hypothetical protein